MSEFIQFERSGATATVTLNRPDIHNAFDDAMMRELADRMGQLGGDDNVRAIVIAGAGKSFSAGADIGWMKRMVDYSFEENVGDARVLVDMLRSIRDCPKPVVARVQGAAFGGAVGLVAACDMAVAVERATFCLSEVRLGIIPAVISPFLVEKIRLSAARRYALTAERFDATEARRIGLVHETVTDAAGLDEWISRIVVEFSKNGPQAVIACKRLLREVANASDDHVHETTVRRIAEHRVSPEGQEGLRAFLEKRPPAWTRQEGA